MKLPYKIREAGSQLYRAGVDYYDFGTVENNLFDYFKTDKITDEQVATLRAYCPDVQIRGGRSEFAPELKRTFILFPKAAWYRQNKGAQK